MVGEIVGRLIQFNADLIYIRAADVEGVSVGNFCFAGFGFRLDVPGKNSGPAIALRRINAKARWLHDGDVNIRGVN